MVFDGAVDVSATIVVDVTILISGVATNAADKGGVKVHGAVKDDDNVSDHDRLRSTDRH